MRSIILAVFTVAVSVLGVHAANVPAELASTCTKNTCFETVEKQHQQGGRGGCKAFFKKTVIPATVTSTFTKTVPTTNIETSIITSSGGYASTTTTTSLSSVFTSTSTETVTPTSTTTTTFTLGPSRRAKRSKAAPATTTSLTTVPHAAASACINTVSYSSACSCVGAKHLTTTLATPTTTTTITKTSTVTTTTQMTTTTTTSIDPDTLTISTSSVVTTYSVTTTSDAPASTETDIDSEEFVVQVSSDNTAIDGQYLELPNGFDVNAGLTADPTTANLWTVNNGGQWHSTTGHFAEEDNSGGPREYGVEEVFFVQGSHRDYAYLLCGANEYTGAFTCSDFLGYDKIFSVCGGILVFGHFVPDGCDKVTLTAIFNSELGSSSSSGFSGSSSST